MYADGAARFEEPNQSSEGEGVLDGAGEAGEEAGVAERFAAPNQSSAGVVGLEGAEADLKEGSAGAGVAGADERFELANQSSTGVATLGAGAGVCTCGGIAVG